MIIGFAQPALGEHRKAWRAVDQNDIKDAADLVEQRRDRAAQFAVQALTRPLAPELGQLHVAWDLIDGAGYVHVRDASDNETRPLFTLLVEHGGDEIVDNGQAR